LHEKAVVFHIVFFFQDKGSTDDGILNTTILPPKVQVGKTIFVSSEGVRLEIGVEQLPIFDGQFFKIHGAGCLTTFGTFIFTGQTLIQKALPFLPGVLAMMKCQVTTIGGFIGQFLQQTLQDI
jgi:hypothetical protein